jgi:hypothetical protein
MDAARNSSNSRRQKERLYLGDISTAVSQAGVNGGCSYQCSLIALTQETKEFLVIGSRIASSSARRLDEDLAARNYSNAGVEPSTVVADYLPPAIHSEIGLAVRTRH